MKRPVLHQAYFIWMLVLALVCQVSIYAQSDFRGFTINPKIGLWYENYFDSEFKDGGGASLGIQFAYLQGERQYALRFTAASEPIFVPGGGPGSGEVYQLNLLYGWHRTGGIGRMKILVGPGFYWGHRLAPVTIADPYENENSIRYNNYPFHAPGLHFQCGMDLHLTHWMSWGMALDAYLHTEGFGLTPVLSIEFGKIREPYEN